MALVVIPDRLPTLEPIVAAVTTALQTDIVAALAAAGTKAVAKGGKALTLAAPARYQKAVVRDYSLIQDWPTVAVIGWNIRVHEANEQIGSQQWLGTVEIDCYLQIDPPDDLAIALSRYAAAIWLVMINADEKKMLSGAELQYSAQEMVHTEPLGTPTQRATRLVFDILFRT